VSLKIQTYVFTCFCFETTTIKSLFQHGHYKFDFKVVTIVIMKLKRYLSIGLPYVILDTSPT